MSARTAAPTPRDMPRTIPQWQCRGKHADGKPNSRERPRGKSRIYAGRTS